MPKFVDEWPVQPVGIDRRSGPETCAGCVSRIAKELDSLSAMIGTLRLNDSDKAMLTFGVEAVRKAAEEG